MPPRVAITLGDPRGIGPEVVSKTLADPPAEAEYVVIGPDELVAELPAAERIGIGAIGKRGEGIGKRAADQTFPAEDAGRLTADAVLKAVELALSGDVDAIVTGPAEKRALHAAGYEYPGHTEWLAELAGGVDVVMMLVAGSLRVALVTTHIPLAEVPSAVTIERVLRAGHITGCSATRTTRCSRRRRGSWMPPGRFPPIRCSCAPCAESSTRCSRRITTWV
jgi:4-hydroxythreonine-4-phosphate dehydrogenase